MSREEDYSELLSLWVDPRFLRRGCATWVVAALSARVDGPLVAWASRDNQAAQAFWSGIGWAQSGSNERFLCFNRV